MIEIIPTILVKTQEEAEERVKTMGGKVSWMQIDVVDGKFAPNITWGDPNTVKNWKTDIRFEIDLMVQDPETAVREWCKAAPKVGRIYFHQESAGAKTQQIIEHIKNSGIEAGISLNPNTSYKVLLPFTQKLDAVLFLGVDPGFNASPFQETVIESVRYFHGKFPNIPITVDGGIRPGIARQLAESGANRLASGSYIFGSDTNPLTQLEALRQDILGF